jgi:hypothetical protein
VGTKDGKKLGRLATELLALVDILRILVDNDRSLGIDEQ